MSFKDSESPVEFKPEDVLPQGVKFGDRSDPVVPSGEDSTKISDPVGDNSARNPIHGRTMYPKSRVLSCKQMAELLSKGRTNVMVLRATGVHTKNGVKRLISEVTRLRKLLDKPRIEE